MIKNIIFMKNPHPLKLAISVLILAVILGVALRIVGIIGKTTISHDEGISYMSATGHQGEYSRVRGGDYPFGAWVKASEWKRFIQIDKIFCFGQISYDLAHHDIHPPMYFWLLHLWSLMVGIQLWTGPSLNILFVLIAAVFLFRFARYVLDDHLEAALVVFIWMISPAVLSISLEARQYDLLALLAIIFMYQIIKSADLTKRFKLPEFILLMISTAAGALTHYSFLFIVTGCCGFLLIKLIREDRNRLIKSFVSIGFGYIISIFLNPGFYLAFVNQHADAQPFRYAEIAPRIATISVSFLSFFFFPFRWMMYKYICAILLVALIFIFFNIHRKERPGIMAYFRKEDFKIHYIFFLFIWLVGSQIIAYLAFILPSHAVGERYYCMIWPAFACVVVFLLRLFGKLRLIFTILLCFGLFMAGSSKMLYTKCTNRSLEAILRNSRYFLIDNVARGVFPMFFWHLPDDKIVYAANQDHLLDKSERWLNRIDDNTFYFSSILYGNTKEKQGKILVLIKREHGVSSVEAEFLRISDAYLYRTGKKIK